jgi:hypothetical protein
MVFFSFFVDYSLLQRQQQLNNNVQQRQQLHSSSSIHYINRKIKPFKSLILFNFPKFSKLSFLKNFVKVQNQEISLFTN